MCGIAGIIYKGENRVVERCDLEVMAAAIRHRGPDGEGIHLDRHRGFLNVRLAIVDRADGSQPIYNEDGRIGIVYNGEVYNYRTLREHVIDRGHRLKTQTDTEVIVHLFEEHGEAAFAKLQGMFAFALWDADTVYLVRDRIGIKPLYIYEDFEKIVFCSELRGILALDSVTADVSPAGLADYLTFRYVRGPQTIFRQIRKLAPGHFVKITKGEQVQKRYWSLTLTQVPIGIDESTARIRDLMRASVGSQLIGEAPIGLLLSGGVDSSTIAYFLAESGIQLKTFSIGFPSVNEFRYSDLVARRLGLEHQTVVMTNDELAQYLPRYIKAIDEPIADAACLPLYRLCEEIKKHVTVLLSGEGGDELFAGYPQYARSLSNKCADHGRAFNDFLDYSSYFTNNSNLLRAQASLPAADAEFLSGSSLNRLLRFDMQTWLPDDLMMKADKILMAHSLEGRFPFLDESLMEFVNSLPESFKLDPNRVSKWILKQAMCRDLPEDILARPKMGFTVPIDLLLLKVRDQVFDLLETETELGGLINLDEARLIVRKHFSHQVPNALRVFTIFVLVYWLRTVRQH